MDKEFRRCFRHVLIVFKKAAQGIHVTAPSFGIFVSQGFQGPACKEIPVAGLIQAGNHMKRHHMVVGIKPFVSRVFRQGQNIIHGKNLRKAATDLRQFFRRKTRGDNVFILLGHLL